jgi:hypothetical protein
VLTNSWFPSIGYSCPERHKQSIGSLASLISLELCRTFIHHSLQMSSGHPVEGEPLVESAIECESAFELESPVEDAFLVEGNPVESPIQYPPQTGPPSPRPQVYKPMSSFRVEPVEAYRQGGYHIVHIGDILGPAGAKQYKIIHKLGFGGFSTVVSVSYNSRI